MGKIRFTEINSKKEPFIKEFTTMNELLSFVITLNVPMNFKFIGTNEEKLAFSQTFMVENNA